MNPTESMHDDKQSTWSRFTGRRFSRRTIIQTGLFGSAALSLGSLACGRPSRKKAADFQTGFLTKEGRAIFYSAALGVLKDCLPQDNEKRRHQIVTNVVQSIDDYITYLPAATQAEIQEAFDFLSIAPVRWFLAGIYTDWESANPEDVADWLDSWRDSSLGMFRSVYFFIQSMVSLAYFDQPAAWQLIGYPGPDAVWEKIS